MTKSRSINLIIQGPIISPGTNGQGKKVDYNCVNNINQVLGKYKNLFKHIVLVTWKEEDVSTINKHENLHIIQVEDIGGDFKRPSNIFWKTENIKRQFLSTWAGVNYLSNIVEDTDLVIKLRTDQSLDLNLLIDEMENVKKNGDDKIIIPFISLKPFFYPCDYFFAGSHKIMQKFLSDQLYSLFVFMNAHESMVFNYYHNNKRKVTELQKIINLLCWNERRRVKHIYNNFNLFSKELIFSCYWRGAYITDIDNKLFDFEYPKLFNLKHLLLKYVNIKRYFITGVLKRKLSKQRLQSLIEIMENKNKKMIITIYKPH